MKPSETHLYTVTVTDYAADGSGVARLPDGRVVFIPGGAREDVCEIILIKEQSRSCRAELVRLLSPSPYRAESDCPVYRDCGGCDFRHITYEEELRAKLTRVNDALERIGGAAVRAGEILTTRQPDGYRNKAVFHSNGTSLGFFRAGSHEIVPVRQCLLLRHELNAALRDAPPNRDVTFAPDRETLDGLTFIRSGESFFQVNTGAALLLYRKAREYAALAKNETLLDMYCGVGTLTLFLGWDAGRAIGVERESSAVENARANAKRNGIDAEFICADAAAWESGSVLPDCVVVDPPRKGLSSGAIRKISELSPPRLVYISCDPATLARDIKALEGYEARQVCAVDMFPRTANVECCALLRRAEC